jgi:hypothetical protein
MLLVKNVKLRVKSMPSKCNFLELAPVIIPVLGFASFVKLDVPLFGSASHMK